MRVIRMSATSGKTANDKAFRLDIDPHSGTFDLCSKTDNGKETNAIKQRYEASKRLTIMSSADVNDSIATEAGNIAANKPGSRIVIFVKTPKAVNAVRKSLIKKDKSRETKIAQLTGTMRGLERDELVDLGTPVQDSQHERRVMQRFLLPDNDSSQGECFLISTSAGEVGFDLNADHLVGDAAPLDYWIQRLGRVNRRGSGDATVILVRDKDPADKTEFDKACIFTSELFTDGMDVSPSALTKWKDSLWNNLSPQCLRLDVLVIDEAGWVEHRKQCAREVIRAASSPEPTMVELTDVLLDTWSMTSIIQPMPGRPQVGPWLRGINDELPQTTIAWRVELDEAGFADQDIDDVEEWFDTHRILRHETLSVPTSDAATWFISRWRKLERWHSHLVDRPIVIDRAGMTVVTVKQLIDQLSRRGSDNTSMIRYADLILPASFGGIERGIGMLDAAAPEKPEDDKDADEQTRAQNARQRLAAADVADVAPAAAAPWRKRLRKVITTSEDGESAEKIIGNGTMPPKPYQFRLDLKSDDDGRIRLESYVARREKPEVGSQRQTLCEHVSAVRSEVDEILENISLPDNARADIRLAARLAAEFHDHGKNREGWQRIINGTATQGTTDWMQQLTLEGDGTQQCLGKSGGKMKRESDRLPVFWST